MDVAAVTVQYPWCVGKVITRDEAARLAGRLRREGETLVTVNGSFDLFHAGHLVILQEAKAQGDILFVGVNTDASVRQYKGAGRPVIPEAARVAVLAGLSCVDYVVPIDAPEAGREILLAVWPHLHVNGNEYGQPETWVEWPTMQEVGARGHAVQRQEGLATTEIIEKVRRL